MSPTTTAPPPPVAPLRTAPAPVAAPTSRRGADGPPRERAASWYADTAHAAPRRPRLEDDVEADVCIVGAGFGGLSAALHLVAAGREVTVLEAVRVGRDASWRNGGQIVNGLNAGLDRIERRYGDAAADFVGSMLCEGGAIVRALIAEHGIECDLKGGSVVVARDARRMRALEAREALWRRHDMDGHELLDRSALRAHVGSDLYVGGTLDRAGGHLHPLNLALGEAAALERAGGRIHEASRVVRIDDVDGRPVVHTERGRVRPAALVLCGNAHLGRVVPELEARTVAVSTHTLATEPLDEALAGSLLPSDACVEDSSSILDHCRLTPDRRLLFGGASARGGRAPEDIVAELRPRMRAVFPALADVTVDHAWSDDFALSSRRAPQLGRLGPNSYHAMAYSGHGVTCSHLFGRLIAEAITGERSRFERLAAMRWSPFPGGRRIASAGSASGSWWHGLRDRIGV